VVQYLTAERETFFTFLVLVLGEIHKTQEAPPDVIIKNEDDDEDDDDGDFIGNVL